MYPFRRLKHNLHLQVPLSALSVFACCFHHLDVTFYTHLTLIAYINYKLDKIDIISHLRALER